MTEEQLIETFEKEHKEFLKYKWNDPEMILNLSYITYTDEPFMEDFHTIFNDIIVNDIRGLVLRIQNRISSEISLHTEEKTSIIINQRIEKVAKIYMKNPYKTFANSENVLNIFFKPEIYKRLGQQFARNYQKEYPKHHCQNGYMPKTLDVISDEIAIIKQLIAILIENKLLKIRLQELKPTRSVTNSSANKFTRNQTVLLFDRLGFLNIMEDYSNVSKAKLISIISGYGYDNIKKSIEALEKPPKELNKQYQEDSNTIEAFIKGLS